MMNAPTLFGEDAELRAENERLRAEVAYLRAENQRLLSDPGLAKAGKYTRDRSGSRESQRAALRVLPKTGTKRSRVLELLAEAYPGGLTDEEVQLRTEWDIRCCNARRKELEEGGWVVKADEQRRARSGHQVAVWRLSTTGAERLLWGAGEGER
jgi:hypothetical protein